MAHKTPGHFYIVIKTPSLDGNNSEFAAYDGQPYADIIKSIFVQKTAPMCDSWVANDSEKHGSITVGPLLPKHMRVQFLFKCY